MVGYCWAALVTWLASPGKRLVAAAPVLRGGILDNADLQRRCR